MQHTDLSKLRGVVAIGGGHGLGRLLSAFDFLEEKLTGIVTTTDNGGSTGRLREETGCIAWGDLRNCLSHLAKEKNLKSLLFDYRFQNDGGSLSGHALGNLMLLALDDMCVRPMDTLNMFRDFLHIKSGIVPMTETPAHLMACNEDGCDLMGEVNIDAAESIPSSLKIVPDVAATNEAVEAIRQAELILMGPGSFLTSVVPPLLIPEINQAINNSNAAKILIANMVPEDGPTGKASLSEKMQWMRDRVGENLVDAIIWPESRELKGEPPSNVVFADLYYSEHDRLHDKAKLVKSVQKVYSSLLNEKSLKPRIAS